MIILDEPTAALGVAQTAEVLDLIERVKHRGLGVVMVSHNMEDVRAVADRIVVLRLGRNNGEFDAKAVTTEQLVAAITGASDNAVTRRRDRGTADSEDGSGDTMTTTPTAPTALDRGDERLQESTRVSAAPCGRSGAASRRATSACCRWSSGCW